MNMKLIGALAAIVIAVLALALMAPGTTGMFTAKQEDSGKIIVGYTPIAHQLPLFLAKERGYFDEAGLKVELVKFDAPNQLNDAVMQGKVDFTPPGMASGIPAIADYKNPGKIKLYILSGGTMDHPSARMLVQANSTITSIADLEGKKMGIFGGSIQWRTIAKEILAKKGLVADKDVTLVELAPANQVQALATGQIDALLALEPTATVALNTKVAKVIDYNPAEEIIAENTWLGSGIVNLAYAKANPAASKKFIEVMEKAVKEIRADPKGSAKYLVGYTAITPELAPQIIMPQYKFCSEMDSKETENMQKFLDIFTQYGVVEGKLDAKGLLYCS